MHAMTTQPYHHGDLRNALIKIAIKLVEEGGAEEFSLREAARLAGVSANAAYRHFADKSDLVTAVAEEGFSRLGQRILKALAAVPERRFQVDMAVERLKAAGRAYVAFAVDHPELLRVMFGTSGLAALEGGVSLKPVPFVLLGKALDDLVRSGVLPAERRPGAELKAWTVVHGFASLVIQAGGAAQRKAARTEALEAVLEFALIGLCGRLD